MSEMEVSTSGLSKLPPRTTGFNGGGMLWNYLAQNRLETSANRSCLMLLNTSFSPPSKQVLEEKQEAEESSAVSS